MKWPVEVKSGNVTVKIYRLEKRKHGASCAEHRVYWYEGNSAPFGLTERCTAISR